MQVSYPSMRKQAIHIVIITTLIVLTIHFDFNPVQLNFLQFFFSDIC